MPENTSPHPGSWIGDLGNEWKTAKPPEKVMIVGAIVATIGIALYLHGKSTAAPNQPGAQDTSGLGGIPANFQQGGGGGGGSTTSGGGITAQPPTQNPPAPTPTPKPTGTPTPKPVSQPTTLTRTYGSTNHAPSAPYKVQGVSPALARVAAQRADILQLRKEQTAPKPILRVTPAQTYLQVGNRKLY